MAAKKEINTKSLLQKMHLKDLEKLAKYCKLEFQPKISKKDLIKLLIESKRSTFLDKALAGEFDERAKKNVMKLPRRTILEVAEKNGIDLNKQASKAEFIEELSSTEQGLVLGAILGGMFALFKAYNPMFWMSTPEWAIFFMLAGELTQITFRITGVWKRLWIWKERAKSAIFQKNKRKAGEKNQKLLFQEMDLTDLKRLAFQCKLEFLPKTSKEALIDKLIKSKRCNFLEKALVGKFDARAEKNVMKLPKRVILDTAKKHGIELDKKARKEEIVSDLRLTIRGIILGAILGGIFGIVQQWFPLGGSPFGPSLSVASWMVVLGGFGGLISKVFEMLGMW